jgi:hypothetical protein
VQIVFSVGVEVMATMVSSPPERPFLIGRRPCKGEHELECSASPVGTVREKAMEPGGNRKHAHDIQGQTGDDCHHAHACPDGEQASQMHEEELKADEVIRLFSV